MSADNDSRGRMFIFVQTSDSEMQKRVDEAEKTTESAIDVINFQSTKCQRIQRNYEQTKTENDKLKLLNESLAINNSQLAQKNQQLATENKKLKSEHEIRQERANNITPIQTTQFSIFGAIKQIKRSIEKENRPNCGISNDNKSIDKNS